MCSWWINEWEYVQKVNSQAIEVCLMQCFHSHSTQHWNKKRCVSVNAQTVVYIATSLFAVCIALLIILTYTVNAIQCAEVRVKILFSIKQIFSFYLWRCNKKLCRNKLFTYTVQYTYICSSFTLVFSIYFNLLGSVIRSHDFSSDTL